MTRSWRGVKHRRVKYNSTSLTHNDQFSATWPTLTIYCRHAGRQVIIIISDLPAQHQDQEQLILWKAMNGMPRTGRFHFHSFAFKVSILPDATPLYLQSRSYLSRTYMIPRKTPSNIVVMPVIPGSIRRMAGGNSWTMTQRYRTEVSNKIILMA